MAKIKIYRGISAESQAELDKYIKDFYDKSSTFITHGGGRNLGEGAYFTTSRSEAEGYAKNFKFSHVFEIEVDTEDFLDISKIDINKEFSQYEYFKQAKATVDKIKQSPYINYDALDNAESKLMDAQDKALTEYVKSKGKLGVFDPNISEYRRNAGKTFVLQSKDVLENSILKVVPKKSSKYWDKRAINRLTEAEKLSEKYINRVKGIYNQANKNIEKELASVYRNYSKETGLDTQKLKELLTRSESQKTWEQMKRQGLDKYIKDNYKSRITRLEQLQAQIYAKAKMIYPKEELENTMCYKGVINQSYYKTMYDTQMGTGYNFDFATIDSNMTKALLNESWSGKNYSQRIWGNTDILANSLSEILGGAMLSGQSIEKTSKQIRDRFNVGKYYAERLIRTETNHFNNEADAIAYEEMGVEKYVFVATLDSKTSEICQEMDGKIFNLKDRAEGINYPPLHPNCRSKTRGYINEEAEKNLQRRARNPITGKNEIVDNIPYKEWIKQYQNKDSTKPVKQTVVKDNKYTFSPAKNLDEVETRLKNIVGANTIKLNKMDLNVANDYLAGIEEFYNDYPKFRGFVQNISTKVTPREMAHFEMTSIKNENGRTLNTGYQLRNPREPNKLQENIKYMIDNNFLYKNSTLRTISIHEATHSLDFAITMKNLGLFENGKFNTEQINKMDWHTMSSSNAYKIIMEARKDLFGKENGKEIYEAQKVLGEYSFTNYCETLAQAISYEYSGQSTPYTKKIKEIFDRYYKEAFEK